MLRTILTTLTITVATTVLGPTAAVGSLLGIGERVSQWCMHVWARSVCFAAGVKVVVHGMEHVNPDRGTVYASNHVSWFDVFAIAAVLPRYTFVAKAELRKIPIFGWSAEQAGVVFLARENRRSAFEAYAGVAKLIHEGRSVVVCPEGTRGRDYHLRPFKKGPFVLAIAAKAPVVPVVTYGAREVMPKGSAIIRAGTVHVHFLAPVPTTDYDYETRHDLMRLVWTRMADHMREHFDVTTHEFPIAPSTVERLA